MSKKAIISCQPTHPWSGEIVVEIVAHIGSIAGSAIWTLRISAKLLLTPNIVEFSPYHRIGDEQGGDHFDDNARDDGDMLISENPVMHENCANHQRDVECIPFDFVVDECEVVALAKMIFDGDANR